MFFPRGLFFLLILANLVLFAWGQGYFGVVEGGREPQRLTQQIAQEKIQLRVLAADAVASTRLACRLVSGLLPAEAAALQAAATAQAGWQSRILDGQDTGFRLVIADLANRPAAERKLAELRGLAVREAVIDESGGKFLIVLARAGSEAEAAAAQARLSKQGVRSAQIERNDASAAPRVELRAAPEALARSLPALTASYAKAVLADCPAP